jgi:creatinine amidohydrolase/Fe(II)-dependent formamide hydrolase-like protein
MWVFPGTLSVSAQTFLAVVRDLGASIAASGFKKVVLYNTHGGNTRWWMCWRAICAPSSGCALFAVRIAGRDL